MEFVLKKIESVNIYRLHNGEWQYVTTLTDVKVPNWEGKDNVQKNRSNKPKIWTLDRPQL